MRWVRIALLGAAVAAPLILGGPAERKAAPEDPYDPNCLSAGCHGDLKERDVVHGPIAVGACDTCHEPAPPGHRFTATRKEPALCTFCHLPVDEKNYVHTAVEVEDCTACHDPHGASTKALLTTATAAELCAECHARPKDEFIHGPVAVGECMSCHEAHQSDHADLLRVAGAALCTGCHSDTAKTISASKYPHEPATKDCTTCHLPHGASNASFLRKPPGPLCVDCHAEIGAIITERPVVHGAVKELEQCANCHTPHAADLPHQLLAPAMTLCLGCHDKEIEIEGGKKLKNIAEVLETSEFKHGPIREGDCLPCHNSHASVNYRLLEEVFPEAFYEGFDVKNYALCFSCHQKSLVIDKRTTTLTGFRDGDLNLHFVHVNKEVKGRTCRACHEIHASSLPKHIRRSVPFGAGGWQLPINFSKTETGGTCSPGCHKTLSYDRKQPSE